MPAGTSAGTPINRERRLDLPLGLVLTAGPMTCHLRYLISGPSRRGRVQPGTRITHGMTQGNSMVVAARRTLAPTLGLEATRNHPMPTGGHGTPRLPSSARVTRRDPSPLGR